MRPIYQNSGTIPGATFNFPVIVPDIMLTPGNATWIAKIAGAGSSATATLYFSNDDPFALDFNPATATWVQEQAAFQNPGTGAAQATLPLVFGSVTAGVGAYSFLPRILQFRLTGCASSPNVTIEFVQASGGQS